MKKVYQRIDFLMINYSKNNIIKKQMVIFLKKERK